MVSACLARRGSDAVLRFGRSCTVESDGAEIWWTYSSVAWRSAGRE